MRISEHEDPGIVSLVEAALVLIDGEMRRTYWNKKQRELNSPFSNTGSSYSNPTFTVRAYEWDEEAEWKPNFEYKGLKVEWYKYLGRGMIVECDHEITARFLADMLNDCIQSLEKEDYKDCDL